MKETVSIKTVQDLLRALAQLKHSWDGARFPPVRPSEENTRRHPWRACQGQIQIAEIFGVRNLLSEGNVIVSDWRARVIRREFIFPHRGSFWSATPAHIISPGPNKLEVGSLYLKALPIVTIAVLPLTLRQGSFDVNLAALSEVLIGYLCLVAPEGDAKSGSMIVRFTRLILSPFGGGDGKIAYRRPLGGIPKLRVPS